MIDNLNILLPEMFLLISIFILLMLGVFIKNSYNLITKLSLIILIATSFIILNINKESVLIFSDSFIRDPFANFIKILILISSIFIKW